MTLDGRIDVHIEIVDLEEEHTSWPLFLISVDSFNSS